MSTDDDPDLCDYKRSRVILKVIVETDRLAQVRLSTFSQLITLTSQKKGNIILLT